jgi:hypothetical protein
VVPPYSKPSVARELRAVLAELAEVELNAQNLTIMEGIE